MSKTRFAMSTKKILLLLVLIVLAYFPAKMGFSKLKGILQLKLMARTFDGDSKGLQSTVILPALDSPMVAGKNNIWCSTFQLAWNELKDTEFKEPIKIEGAQQICDTLNNATQTKNDLMSDSYFVDAGKVCEGVIPRIQAGMKAKFPSEKLPDFDSARGFGVVFLS